MRRTAALALAVLLLTACGGAEEESAGTAGAAEPAPVEGVEVLEEDPSHDHVEGPLEYDRVPPLGGPHNPQWLACDVYDEPVPLELAVHSLEHGAVWLAHAPELPEDQVSQLSELAELDEEYVLVAPQERLDADVVAVAWGAALEADGADDPRLRQFVEQYAGGDQGGEPGVPCRGQGLSPREARGLLAEQ